MFAIPPVNLVGVAAATIASFVIGGVWYAPPVFGRMWMELTGVSPERSRGKQGRVLLLGLLANLVTVYILAIVVRFASASSVTDGLAVGFLVWLGFPASVHFVSWVFEKRPAKLSLLNLAHTLVIFLVMGAILAVWA